MNRHISAPAPPRDKKFRPQLHLFLLLLSWVLIGGTACLYAFFVSQSCWRPSRFWWLLTTGSIALNSLCSAWLVVLRFWHGSQRTWSIAIYMFTVWPGVMFLCFVWLVVATANSRGDLVLTWPVRTFGFWVGNYFEWESDWRYPRVTEGQFVELHDRGDTPNVQTMVDEMDLHIQRMSELLGQPTPDTTTAWVRGKLFGQGGRAVGAWALCAIPKGIGELQVLDRHEVAHTAITVLCNGYQDPPMLLAEGWAQSQSNDHRQLIKSLQRTRRGGLAFSLNELVSEDLYGRSIGPNYSHGGPLAIYLLDRFGGPKFFELYSQVRRPTFLEDAKRILGVSWSEIDAEFWMWLEEQRSEEGVRQAIVFSDEQVEEQWNEIRAAVIAYEKANAIALPESIAFQVLFKKRNYLMSIVKQRDGVWMITEFLNKKYSTTFARQSLQQGDFYLEESEESGLLEGDQEMQKGDTTLRFLIKNAWRRAQAGSLRHQYITDILVPQDYENTSIEISVQSIQAGEKPSDPWTVNLVETWDDDVGASSSTDRLTLDPTNGFRVIELVSTIPDGETHKRSYEYGEIENIPVSTESSLTINSTNGKETTSGEQLTLLTDEQSDKVKHRVESAHEQHRQMLKFDWTAFFINPYSIGFGWLLLAFAILAIDTIGNRIKIPVPATQPQPEAMQ